MGLAPLGYATSGVGSLLQFVAFDHGDGVVEVGQRPRCEQPGHTAAKDECLRHDCLLGWFVIRGCADARSRSSVRIQRFARRALYSCRGGSIRVRWSAERNCQVTANGIRVFPDVFSVGTTACWLA